MAYCVGLTGGIGCGKSTVAQMFQALGAAVIDTDTISHALTQANAPALQTIAQQFGPDMLSPQGELQRAKLRTLIFSDGAAKAQLEAILHPLIQAQVQQDISVCRAPYALIVVPLLFETGHYLPLIQRSLVVDCEEASQIRRTMARSHFSESEVCTNMSHQLPRSERRRLADDILLNEADIDALRTSVLGLHKQYLAQALSLD